MIERLKFNGQKLTRFVLFTTSSVLVVLYVTVAVQRLMFPFDIDWSEGAGLLQVARILSGEGLYQAPSLEFAPLIYTPLYYYLAAGVSLFLGRGFLSLRLVSFLFSMASYGLIIWIVYQKTEDGMAAWVSGALFIASFALSDGFYDLARPDSVFVFLLLITFLIFLSARRRLSLILLGISIATTFYAKQSGLLVFIPLLVYAIATLSKKSIYILGSLIISLGLTIGIWEKISSGWFTYYIFELPGEHGYSIVDAVNFWVGDSLRPLGISFSIVLIYIFLVEGHGRMGADRVSERYQETFFDEKVAPYFLFAVGAILASWITRSSNGGAANNNMPMYASLSILLGLGYADIKEKLATWEIRRVGEALLSLILAIQFVGLLYNPFAFIPTSFDKALNQKMLDMIRETEGEIFIPYRSHLPSMVDKSPHIHIVNLFELVGYFHGEEKSEGKELIQQLRIKICQQEYGALILDQPVPWIEEHLRTYYQPSGDLEVNEEFSRSQELDWQNGYMNIYLPREGFGSDRSCENP